MASTRYIQESMQGNLFPPISYLPQPFSETEVPRAIYVKDFNELFTEVDVKQRNRILENLDDLLKAVDAKDRPTYIEFSGSSEFTLRMCLTALKKQGHLDILNHISMQFKTKYTHNDFLRECKQRGITSYWGGGVYGSACVMQAATEQAVKIQTVMVPDVHPSIRYKDTSPATHRFDMAVLVPEIHTKDSKFLSAPVVYAPAVTFPLSTTEGNTRKAIEQEKIIARHNRTHYKPYKKYSPLGNKKENEHLHQNIEAGIKLEKLCEAIPIVEAMSPEAVTNAASEFKPRTR